MISADPQVSVVMPVFNAERWIGATLQSLAQQTFKNWELVVVDDGSTDASIARIEGISAGWAQPVRIIRSLTHGPSAARNLGIASATGEFVAFLDADDLWHSSKIERQLHAVRTSPGSIGCVCGYEVFRGDPSKPLHTYVFHWSVRSLTRWVLSETYGPGLCSTLLVRLEVLQSTGGFDEELRIYEDFDLAWRLNAEGLVVSIPDVLMGYRLSEAQNHRDKTTAMRNYQQMMLRPPIADSPSLQRRARANVHAFLAMRGGPDVPIGRRIRHVAAAFTTDPVQPFRLARGWLERRAS